MSRSLSVNISYMKDVRVMFRHDGVFVEVCDYSKGSGVLPAIHHTLAALAPGVDIHQEAFPVLGGYECVVSFFDPLRDAEVCLSFCLHLNEHAKPTLFFNVAELTDDKSFYMFPAYFEEFTGAADPTSFKAQYDMSSFTEVVELLVKKLVQYGHKRKADYDEVMEYARQRMLEQHGDCHGR